MSKSNPQQVIDRVRDAVMASNLPIEFPALAFGMNSIALPYYDFRPYVLWGQKNPNLDFTNPDSWPEGVEPPRSLPTEALIIPVLFGDGPSNLRGRDTIGVSYTSLVADPKCAETVISAIYDQYTQWETKHGPNAPDREPDAGDASGLRLTNEEVSTEETPDDIG